MEALPEAPTGRNKTAQGNALGSTGQKKFKPCRGVTIPQQTGPYLLFSPDSSTSCSHGREPMVGILCTNQPQWGGKGVEEIVNRECNESI